MCEERALTKKYPSRIRKEERASSSTLSGRHPKAGTAIPAFVFERARYPKLSHASPVAFLYWDEGKLSTSSPPPEPERCFATLTRGS